MSAIRLNLARSYLRARIRRKRTVQMSLIAALLWVNYVTSRPSISTSRSVLPHLAAIAVAACIVKTSKQSMKRNFEQQQEAKSLYHRVAKCQNQDEFCQTMNDVYKHFAEHSY
jgi:hypothetical protein